MAVALVGGAVLKGWQDDEAVLIELAPRLFRLLPKSIASQGFGMNGLLQAQEAVVGPAV